MLWGWDMDICILYIINTNFMVFSLYICIYLLAFNACRCNKNAPKEMKLLWVIVIIFTNIIGALIYYFLEKKKKSSRTTEGEKKE